LSNNAPSTLPTEFYLLSLSGLLNVRHFKIKNHIVALILIGKASVETFSYRTNVKNGDSIIY